MTAKIIKHKLLPFCNVKTDYNTSDAQRLIDESWDESSSKAHWRNQNRRKNQPFFSVFNIMTSHQSRTMVWPYSVFKKHVQSKLSASEIHDPKNAPVPEYYPDTCWMPPECHLNVQYQEIQHPEVNHLSLLAIILPIILSFKFLRL